MQYILSQQEYDDLKNRDTVLLKETTKTLQYACSAYANYYNTINKITSSSLACIDGDPYIYCSDCPVVTYCPSKNKDYPK